MSSHSFVVFSKVVGKIFSPRFPEDVKNVVVCLVLHPIKPHIDCFGEFLFDCIVDDAKGCCIVIFDGGCWLYVS